MHTNNVISSPVSLKDDVGTTMSLGTQNVRLNFNLNSIEDSQNKINAFARFKPEPFASGILGEITLDQRKEDNFGFQKTIQEVSSFDSYLYREGDWVGKIRTWNSESPWKYVSSTKYNTSYNSKGKSRLLDYHRYYSDAWKINGSIWDSGSFFCENVLYNKPDHYNVDFSCSLFPSTVEHIINTGSLCSDELRVYHYGSDDYSLFASYVPGIIIYYSNSLSSFSSGYASAVEYAYIWDENMTFGNITSLQDFNVRISDKNKFPEIVHIPPDPWSIYFEVIPVGFRLEPGHSLHTGANLVYSFTTGKSLKDPYSFSVPVGHLLPGKREYEYLHTGTYEHTIDGFFQIVKS